MISRQDIQRLLHRPGGDLPILSILLDMAVNEENMRTYRIFLSQQRSEWVGLDGDRESHPRDLLGAAFDRAQQWIDDEFDVSNKGAAIYMEIGGEWFDALQFPVSVPNQVVFSSYPAIGALAQILARPHHFGVIVVDREWLRLIDVRLGTPVVEHEVKTSAYPTPADVKSGGYSAKGYQKAKANEASRFFRVFALEILEFDRRYRPDGLILLGTPDNVQKFLEFLPPELSTKIVHTDRPPAVRTSAEILDRLAPFFDEVVQRNEAEAVSLLRDRVEQSFLAVSGFETTLEQLQEGKIDSLVMARAAERAGDHCLRCGFYLTASDGKCRYCGGTIKGGVDLVEAMIRLASEQEVDITFVDPNALTDLGGTGGLLKF
jgi:hypothetical protein